VTKAIGIDFGVVHAVFRKDFGGYLSNPTGYVFLTLFIGATAAAAFVRDEFFTRNLADLGLLNQVMPYILAFFVSALTMTAWADEARAGTDELLLTLPVRDSEVILGKYLGALAMYSIALLFSITHVIVLAYLGDPDPGLMASTYFGYWLMGALLVAIGLLASIVSTNPTSAFVLSVLAVAGLVFANSAGAGIVGGVGFGLAGALLWLVIRGDAKGAVWAGLIAGGVPLVLWALGVWSGFGDLLGSIALEDHFRSFGTGVVRLADLLYFAGGTVLALYLGVLLLGRRHW